MYYIEINEEAKEKQKENVCLFIFFLNEEGILNDLIYISLTAQHLCSPRLHLLNHKYSNAVILQFKNNWFLFQHVIYSCI